MNKTEQGYDLPDSENMNALFTMNIDRYRYR